MGSYIVRRSFTGLVTLILISIIIFALLDLAPGDPTANLPLSVPQTVREQIRVTLGLDEPFWMRYLLWAKQFLLVEPAYALSNALGLNVPFFEGQLRITSWTSRGVPVMDIIIQRLPQTLWVVGLSYLLAVLIALPLGVLAAYRQNSIFDQASSIVSVIGFSLPTFFTGILVIQIFAVWLGWFPTLYSTTLRVHDWDTFVRQMRQMAMPVLVLTFFQMATISRFTRSSVIDNLKQDYVRTARSKGLREWLVILRHVVRNSLIPVVTLVALAIPGIFGGAIVTEQIFAVNGVGQLLITSLQSNDIPIVQTVLILYAVLVVLFNLIADILYGVLDPRIRYN
jgi:peptide/nickel transport system permease protein